MLKPLVPNCHPELSVRLKDIAEKQVPAKLKLIVDSLDNTFQTHDLRPGI